MRSLSKASPKPERKPPATLAEAKGLLSHFCSYQERSIRQVNQKMKSLGIHTDWYESIIEFLISEGYLNQDRFTGSFVRGKSQGRGWGPKKIEYRLQMEGIGRKEISQSLLETDWKKAESKLQEALIKKKTELDKKQDQNWKSKLIRFSLSRGFEFERAQEIIRKLFEE